MRAIPRRTVLLLGGSPLALIVLAVSIYEGWRAEPAFYSRALAADRQAEVRGSNDLLERASALVNDVREQGPWQALFTAQQINGWLAVDLPANHGDLLPAEWDCPRVSLDRGQVVLACRYGSGTLATVVTLSLAPYVTESNELAIRVCGARAGWFPLPLQPILDQLSQGAAEAGLPLHWEQAGGDPIAVIQLAPRRSDGRLLLLETLEVHSGELYLAGTTRSGSWPADERAPEDDPRGRAMQARLPAGSIDR